jgi:hypothetical protein
MNRTLVTNRGCNRGCKKKDSDAGHLPLTWPQMPVRSRSGQTLWGSTVRKLDSKSSASAGPGLVFGLRSAAAASISIQHVRPIGDALSRGRLRMKRRRRSATSHALRNLHRPERPPHARQHDVDQDNQVEEERNIDVRPGARSEHRYEVEDQIEGRDDR